MAKLNLDFEKPHKSESRPHLLFHHRLRADGSPARPAGHDINYIARSGINVLFPEKKRQAPASWDTIADIASGSNNAVIGILAAVVNRHNTGQGQAIDISMTDGMIAFNAMYGAGFPRGWQGFGAVKEPFLTGVTL